MARSGSVLVLLLTDYQQERSLRSMQSTAQSNSPWVQLSELVHIQPGYLSRGRVHSVPDGTHRLLQARDFSADGGVSLENSVWFHPERNPELYQVCRGDVLVVARGQEHRAYCIDTDIPNTLVSATFYILRPDPSYILPGYLAWWLNLPSVQAQIDAESRGTGISYISRQALEKLSVQVPTLAVQHDIDQTLELWHKIKSIRRRLDEKREQYIQLVCQRAAQQAKE